MIVNGIEWTHPPIGGKLGYYGFDPSVMLASVDGSKLCGEVNFVGREVALVGAAELLALFAPSAA